MQTSDRKLGLLAGLLATGIFLATFASTQMINANAQTNTNSTQQPGNSTGTDETPIPVDTGCPTGAEICTNDSNDTMHSIVTTSGTATAKVQPDKVSVTVGVETNGTTAKEAADRNADQSSKVVDALTGLGIAETNIGTSSYSVYPVYESKPASEQCIAIYPTPPECQPSTTITGYRASSSLTVTLDANGTLDAGQVIDASIGAGANTVQGAYFFISPEKQMQVQQDLIPQAIENARQRATIAAGAVGMGIDKAKSISLNDVYFPVFAKDLSVSEAGATQILPGQQDVTMTVSVVYIMK